MFDDDGEQSPAEKRAEELAPKTRDLASEITPSAADDAGGDDEDFLSGGLLERRDEAIDVNVDGETATAFWAAVIYVNVGLMLVAIGPMLAFFRGRMQVGALLVVLGSFALYRAYTVYRSYTASSEDEGSVADDADPDSAADDTEEGVETDDHTEEGVETANHAEPSASDDP